MASNKNQQHNNLNNILKSGCSDGVSEDPVYKPNLAECSASVQRRVRALKKYQLDTHQLESNFYQRVHELEKEFQPMFDAIFEKRKLVVSGVYEPSDEECNMPLVHELTPEELSRLEAQAPHEDEPSKGVPHFWYNVLNNCSATADLIQEQDIPVLKYLADITTEVHSDPPAFTLYFHFDDNPYFHNKVLEKYYELKLTVDLDEPFDYEGPVIVSCRGDKICWSDEGKNVTRKIIKKTQKKGYAGGKTVTKIVSAESFFNFFEPGCRMITPDMEPDEEDKLRCDFETGQLIRDELIPRAVLFFTGEATDEDVEYYDEEDENDEQEDEEGDDDK